MDQKKRTNYSFSNTKINYLLIEYSKIINSNVVDNHNH